MSVVIVPKFNFPNYIETIEKHRVTHLLYVKDRWSACSVFNPPSFQDRTSNNHPISQGNLQIRSLPTNNDPSTFQNHYRPSSLASVRVVSIAGAPLSELVLKFAEIVPQAAVGQIYGVYRSQR